jgi:hypothetical protein
MLRITLLSGLIFPLFGVLNPPEKLKRPRFFYLGKFRLSCDLKISLISNYEVYTQPRFLVRLFCRYSSAFSGGASPTFPYRPGQTGQNNWG